MKKIKRKKMNKIKMRERNIKEVVKKVWSVKRIME
jgi:hypothetical protein